MNQIISNYKKEAENLVSKRNTKIATYTFLSLWFVCFIIVFIISFPLEIITKSTSLGTIFLEYGQVLAISFIPVFILFFVFLKIYDSLELYEYRKILIEQKTLLLIEEDYPIIIQIYRLAQVITLDTPLNLIPYKEQWENVYKHSNRLKNEEQKYLMAQIHSLMSVDEDTLTQIEKNLIPFEILIQKLISFEQDNKKTLMNGLPEEVLNSYKIIGNAINSTIQNSLDNKQSEINNEFKNEIDFAIEKYEFQKSFSS